MAWDGSSALSSATWRTRCVGCSPTRHRSWTATRRGTTLIHGDLRDDNLALAGDRIVLLDWVLGPPDPGRRVRLVFAPRRVADRRDAQGDRRRLASGGALRVDDTDEALMALVELVLYGWIWVTPR